MAEVKGLVRFDPSVKNFRFRVSSKRLYLHFDAEREVAYKLELKKHPCGMQLVDSFTHLGKLRCSFTIPRQTPICDGGQSQGIFERYGPQKFPMEGRGEQQVDIRIYKIDPLDRNFGPSRMSQC